jgi:hypothetical protein
LHHRLLVYGCYGCGTTGILGSSGIAQAGATVVGNPPEEPMAREVLATCDGHVSDYRNRRISKAAALAYIHTSLTSVLPEGGEAVERPFARYIAILENHDQFIAAAGVRGTRERSPSPEGDKEHEDEGERDVHQARKRARVDPRSDSSNPAYPWNMADGRHVILSANLEKTRILLKLYTTDPKGAKSDLLNQPDCPEFPDGEWKIASSSRLSAPQLALMLSPSTQALGESAIYPTKPTISPNVTT